MASNLSSILQYPSDVKCGNNIPAPAMIFQLFLSVSKKCFLFQKYTGPLVKTDGNYDGRQLFSCHKDRTVLVAFNRIAFPQESVDAKTNAMKTTNVFSPVKPPLDLGERVLWISAENSHELGTVRWIGILPDAASQEYTAGIEFVSH